MPVADIWPYKFEKLEKGRYTFAPVIATIEQNFTKYGYGVSFVEDDTPDREHKPIWKFTGPWNEETNKRDAYNGPHFPKGKRLKLRLSYRTYERDDGATGESFDVVKAELAPQQAAEEDPSESYTAPKTHAPRPLDSRDQSILKQVAFKALTELLVAGQFQVYEKDGVLTRWGTDWVKTYQAFATGRHPEPDMLPSPASTDVGNLPWEPGDTSIETMLSEAVSKSLPAKEKQ